MRKGIKTFFCHPCMILFWSFVLPYCVASFIAGILVLVGDDHPWQGISTEEQRRAIEQHFAIEADRVGHQAGLKYGGIGLISALWVLGSFSVLRSCRRISIHAKG